MGIVKAKHIRNFSKTVFLFTDKQLCLLDFSSDDVFKNCVAGSFFKYFGKVRLGIIKFFAYVFNRNFLVYAIVYQVHNAGSKVTFHAFL